MADYDMDEADYRRHLSADAGFFNNDEVKSVLKELVEKIIYLIEAGDEDQR